MSIRIFMKNVLYKKHDTCIDVLLTTKICINQYKQNSFSIANINIFVKFEISVEDMSHEEHGKTQVYVIYFW